MVALFSAIGLGRQQCVCFLLLLNTSLEFSGLQQLESIILSPDHCVVLQCGASAGIPFPRKLVDLSQIVTVLSVCHLEGCLESHCFHSESPRKRQTLETSVVKSLLLCEVAYLRVKGSVGGWPLGLSVTLLQV